MQNGVTTTITIDAGSNTTVVNAGGKTTTIAGVPTQNDPATGAVTRDGAMLYVMAHHLAVRTRTGQAAIQDGTALTVTAANNVTVTGDILYKTPPVTQTAKPDSRNSCRYTYSGNDNKQVLGIFTATGDIQLNNTQSNGNLE